MEGGLSHGACCVAEQQRNSYYNAGTLMVMFMASACSGGLQLYQLLS